MLSLPLCRMYTRDKKGRLKNAPYVDTSYKWAGGGFLSNVIDLNNFGNIMLYSYQNTEDQSKVRLKIRFTSKILSQC